MTRVEFFVPGTPRPKGSKDYKGMRGGKPVLIESNDATLKPWMNNIWARAKWEMARREPHTGPVVLSVICVFERPSSYPKTKFRPHITKPDGDKLDRAIRDALSGAIYRDDAQVVNGSLVKLWQWDMGTTRQERGPVGCYIAAGLIAPELLEEVMPIANALNGFHQ